MLMPLCRHHLSFSCRALAFPGNGGCRPWVSLVLTTSGRRDPRLVSSRPRACPGEVVITRRPTSYPVYPSGCQPLRSNWEWEKGRWWQRPSGLVATYQMPHSVTTHERRGLCTAQTALCKGQRRLRPSQSPGRLVMPLSNLREDVGALSSERCLPGGVVCHICDCDRKMLGRVPLKAPSTPPIVQ